MDITIKHIKVVELKEFITSPDFKTLTFEPISISRAISYIENPRADKDDTALLLAYEGNKLIGYLGMFTDKADYFDENFKLCWFSCMWVLPEYRRSGIAVRLLKEGYDLFYGNVMITNYIPRSMAAFIKTGQYKELVLLSGYRFYIKLDIKNILHRKFRSAKYFLPFLNIIDLIFNSVIGISRLINTKNNNKNFTFHTLDHFDDETIELIDNLANKSLFQRSFSEFKWMKEFPWVTNKKDNSINYSKYYFSQYSPDFCQWFIQIKNKKRKVIGFMMLTRHKNELKTPYFFCNEEIANDLGNYISQFASQNNIRTIISHNPHIVKGLIRKGKYIFKKKSNYGFLASDKIYSKLDGRDKILFDGDGDGAFT